MNTIKLVLDVALPMILQLGELVRRVIGELTDPVDLAEAHARAKAVFEQLAEDRAKLAERQAKRQADLDAAVPRKDPA